MKIKLTIKKILCTISLYQLRYLVLTLGYLIAVELWIPSIWAALAFLNYE